MIVPGRLELNRRGYSPSYTIEDAAFRSQSGLPGVGSNPTPVRFFRSQVTLKRNDESIAPQATGRFTSAPSNLGLAI